MPLRLSLPLRWLCPPTTTRCGCLSFQTQPQACSARAFLMSLISREGQCDWLEIEKDWGTVVYLNHSLDNRERFIRYSIWHFIFPLKKFFNNGSTYRFGPIEASYEEQREVVCHPPGRLAALGLVIATSHEECITHKIYTTRFPRSQDIKWNSRIIL